MARQERLGIERCSPKHDAVEAFRPAWECSAGMLDACNYGKARREIASLLPVAPHRVLEIGSRTGVTINGCASWP